LWSLWRQGQRPDLQDFLCDAGQLTCIQLAAVLLIDQRERWQDGERIPAESYLALYPGMHTQEEFVVEVAYGEFLLREELEESPNPDDYLRRFPQVADRLRLQFDLHQAVQADQAPTPMSRAPRNGVEQTQPNTGIDPSPEVNSPWPAVPGYEILGELGRGGMGIVYRARQVELNRPVALKMIRAGEDAEPDQMARFRVEAEAVARLQHPHIVQIYEIGKQVRGSGGRVAECPFMALEFVEGGSLAQHLVGRPQPPRQSAQLVETVARAMHFAHQRGILHRDLKPSNILLRRKSEIRNPKSEQEATDNPSGFGFQISNLGAQRLPDFEFRISDFEPKVCDFGLAKVLEEEHAGQTQTGSVIGTPGYMAPEQAAGNSREVGVAADVHALGVILYEILTGRPPFRAATPVQTLDQVRSQEPTPPRRLRAELPYDLETICLKCLQKDPGRRYPSAGELADDLGRFVNGEPIQARPATTPERVFKWAKRHPTLATLWAVSSLAVVAVVVVVFVWNARLQTQRDLAESRRLEAVRNLGKAREVVDHLVTRLAELKLKDMPQMELLRRDLLEDAVKYYQDFARQSEDDLETRLELCRAERRLGDYYLDLGQEDAAQKVVSEAVATLLALNAGFASEASYRQELALANQSLANCLSRSGKRSEAEALFQRAIDLLLPLVAQHPEEPVHQTILANTYGMAGINLGQMGRMQERLDAFRRSEEVLQQVVAQHAEQPRYAQMLAVTRQNVAGALMLFGRLQEAEDILRSIRDIWEKAVAESPNDVNARSKLALTYGNFAQVLRDGGKRQQAEEAFRRAAELQQKMAHDFPRTPHRHAVLAGVLESLAELLIKRGELVEAQLLLEDSVRHQQTRRELEPGDPKALEDLNKAYFALAETLLRRRDHVTAARKANELSALAPASQESQMKAASVLARCAALAESNTAWPDAKRRETAEQYAAQAVKLLGKAVADGMRSLDAVEKDPSFDILRKRADYKDAAQRVTKG
jgi:serine/threonine protein kinase/tetratricopeptide (TPR) repeat protein